MADSSAGTAADTVAGRAADTVADRAADTVAGKAADTFVERVVGTAAAFPSALRESAGNSAAFDACRQAGPVHNCARASSSDAKRIRKK